MEEVDIAIIGGGIAGVSLAYFLTRGASPSILLLEQEDVTGYHATGRSAAEFVLNYNAAEICALARIAKPFFDDPPAGFSAVPLLARRGGLLVAVPGEEEALRAQYEALAGQVPGLEWLTPVEALGHMPFLDPQAFAAAYYDPQYWDIDVDALMQGYLRAIRHAGGTVRTGSGLQRAARRDGRWHLLTKAGEIRARVVVNAAGGWADPVARICGVPPRGLVPLRRTAILADLPEGVEAARLPELNEASDRFYFKPEGGRLLVSPADETPCEPGDVQPEEIDVAWAVHHLQTATSLRVRRVDRAWAGMRTFSPDRLPVVGFDPDAEGFFWLAGQGGYGILTSPALGSLAAALLRGEEEPPAFAAEGLSGASFAPGRLPARMRPA